MNKVVDIGFKDGDDGDGFDTENVAIRPVANGYIVTFSSDDGDEEFIYTNKKDMLLDVSKRI